MDKTMFAMTVFFDGQFWSGVYERQDGNIYSVSKFVFGPEPKDYEIYSFLLENWKRLRFSPYAQADIAVQKYINPKRMQRSVKKELQNTGIGTKAQQALKAQQENAKAERKKYNRRLKELDRDYIFTQKQEKRKKKHKGH
ncbi:YjdF family protein [Lachnospiraceae bacterium NSJ-143]|nr:YjdF family protein [Lachnospiraceae bacterium NSJ-143]